MVIMSCHTCMVWLRHHPCVFLRWQGEWPTCRPAATYDTDRSVWDRQLTCPRGGMAACRQGRGRDIYWEGYVARSRSNWRMQRKRVSVLGATSVLEWLDGTFFWSVLILIFLVFNFVLEYLVFSWILVSFIKNNRQIYPLRKKESTWDRFRTIKREYTFR